LFFPKDKDSKCKKKKYKYEGEKIPKDIYIIDYNLIENLQKMLKTKCLIGITPILFIFDGHGYVCDPNISFGFTNNKSIIGNMN